MAFGDQQVYNERGDRWHAPHEWEVDNYGILLVAAVDAAAADIFEILPKAVKAVVELTC